MLLRRFSSLMWSLASSKCATAKTSSSLAKPMRLQEPTHTSAQVEGQRNGCMHEKEQVSHYLTAIQHYCSTSLVTSLCLVLTKNDQGYREGSGVTDLLPLPLPSSTCTQNPQGLPLPLHLPRSMTPGIMSTRLGLILVPSFLPTLLFLGIHYTSFPSVQS